MLKTPPLSLYVHIPWCIQKCPYCDFNSHAIKTDLPEKAYIEALTFDLLSKHKYLQDRPIESIFFGGGTPSLFSAHAIRTILERIQAHATLNAHCEITLECNPGTIEHDAFNAYAEAGINRISLGAQSFDPTQLKKLGRIHDATQLAKTLSLLKRSAIQNFNIDLMYGLPTQSIEAALTDLKLACQYAPTHLSWYQLTLEPNTLFYRHPPILPDTDHLAEIETAGHAYLKKKGLIQYEISAFSKPHHPCHHNINYWRFGDYLGIGAGAHSKITLADQNTLLRFSNQKHPKRYLERQGHCAERITCLPTEQRLFEFCMNQFRLFEPFSITQCIARTGLTAPMILSHFEQLEANGFLTQSKTCTQNIPYFEVTQFGRRYLNDVLTQILPAA